MSAHASSSFGCAAVGCCRNALSRSRIAPKRSLLTAASTSTSDAAFNRPSAFPFSAMPKNARLTTPDMARQQQGPSAFGPDYNRVSRWSGAVPSSAATDTSTRSYSDTAALSAHSPGQSSPASSSSASNVSPDYDSSPESDLPGSILHQPDHAQITSHLNDLFEGLDPPINPQLAARMLTHKGAISPNAPPSRSQHNSRLSFLGRRILRLYLSIFLHAHANLMTVVKTSQMVASPTDQHGEILETLLSSHALGRDVASRWQLDGHMIWRQVLGKDGRPTGLHKISGEAVEAILGGIFRQYGAASALQVFNSRILPFLNLPNELRNPAMQLARLHGDLSSSLSASSTAARRAVHAEESEQVDASTHSPPAFSPVRAAVLASS